MAAALRHLVRTRHIVILRCLWDGGGRRQCRSSSLHTGSNNSSASWDRGGSGGSKRAHRIFNCSQQQMILVILACNQIDRNYGTDLHSLIVRNDRVELVCSPWRAILDRLCAALWVNPTNAWAFKLLWVDLHQMRRY